MDSRYAAVYRDLYQRHWWWRARERFIERRVAALQLPPHSRILDIGCGDALFFPKLRRYGQVEGLESDATLLSDSTRQRETIYVRPFDPTFDPGKRYHLVLMLDVLEHLPDPDQALGHLATLLEPGGHVLLTVPALRWLWTRHDDFNQHRTRYHRGELRTELARAGLGIADLRYLFAWPVFGKLAVRAAERWSEPTSAAPASVPPKPLNNILAGLTRLDLAIGRRVSLPFGSSLFAHATRSDLP